MKRQIVIDFYTFNDCYSIYNKRSFIIFAKATMIGVEESIEKLQYDMVNTLIGTTKIIDKKHSEICSITYDVTILQFIK